MAIRRILLFGDRQPILQPAVAQAGRRHIRLLASGTPRLLEYARLHASRSGRCGTSFQTACRCENPIRDTSVLHGVPSCGVRHDFPDEIAVVRFRIRMVVRRVVRTAYDAHQSAAYHQRQTDSSAQTLDHGVHHLKLRDARQCEIRVVHHSLRSDPGAHQ